MQKTILMGCGCLGLLLILAGARVYWMTRPANIDWHSRSRDGVSDLRAVRWEGKHLAGANLSGMIFRESWLSGANFQGADLRGTDFGGATYLDDADLRGADLTGAQLQGAYARRANFAGASLKDADLQRANLSGAHLIGVDWSGASLEDATLTAADLSNWVYPPDSLDRANLTDAQLPTGDDIFADTSRCNTIMPTGEVSQDGCFWPSVKLKESFETTDWQGVETAASALFSKVQGGFNAENIRPQCVDLIKLNVLWKEASSGRFSFSKQRSIWESPSVNQDYGKFAEAVGWKQDGRWLKFEDLQFSQSMVEDESIPDGYLPWHRWQVQEPTEAEPTRFIREGFGEWMTRLQECGI